MNFINLTPHAITVATGDESTTFAPSGMVARVATIRTEVAPVGGFRLVTSNFGEVIDLPSPQEGTAFIVSALVLSALGGSRGDVVAPDTGADAVRNDKGHIVAVRGFVQ